MIKLHYAVLYLIIVTTIVAQESHILKINTIRFGALKTAGFKLEQDKEIFIKAVGGGFEDNHRRFGDGFHDNFNMFAYAWILDANSRQMAWRMTIDNTRKNPHINALREFEGKVHLPKGRYEVYYFAREPNEIIWGKGGLPSISDWLKRFLKGGKWRKSIENKCRLQLQGIDQIYTRANINQYHKKIQEQAVISIHDVLDGDSYEKRFSLTEKGEFELYVLGEAIEEEDFDYGWIIKEDDNQKIWESQFENSDYAGGANKNRQWRQSLTLTPGNYTVYFITDNNHSGQKWNANPPYDPNFWGIMLTGIGGKFNPQSIKEYKKPETAKLLQMTKAGNYAYLQEGFEITKPTAVRIYTLGEGSGRKMADYGWITNAETGRKIWEMDYENTHHAGGAEKNRFSDVKLILRPGKYWVYYVTDGTHAYRNWNSRPPRNPSQWGITIYATDSNFNISDVRRFKDNYTDPVVKIIQIGNDQLVERTFSIKKKTSFRVRAQGEGRNGKMFDFGWIENAETNSEVWTMDYYRTKYGGGAGKNRIIDEVISLPPGTYKVFYQTDDSHAYNAWNSRPPRKPKFWGIALFPTKANAEVITEFENQKKFTDQPFIEITRIRSGELVFKSFVVEKATRINILAMGEGRNGKMHDYGWINDMASGERVWEMTYRKTRHAGGAKKNRVTSQTISLSPGQYVVYYRTDDSHAYNNWNSRRPRNPRKWGITLSFADSGNGRDKIKVLETDRQSKEVLCRIVRVRDDEHVRKSFNIDKQTAIQVYAIGEGGNGEMDDFGWIEDRDSHNVVWIMEYDETRWAGGSRKNRSTKMSFMLPAGEYTLHYLTDDSHAYRDWNSDPPDDPRNYGITVYKMEIQ